MGQKYSEVPSVDYWVQLTRSADRAGAGDTLPIREVSRETNFGRWELDRFATMQRLRTRSHMQVRYLPGDEVGGSASGIDLSCVRCGRIFESGDERIIARSVWPAYGERIDYLRHADSERCG